MNDPNPTKSTKGAASTGARSSALAEDEVYGALGALLGTLEVIASDDVYPVAPVQGERLRSALALCHDLQHQIEALLTLSSEDLPERLRLANTRVRPFVEHAVRGARHTFEAQGVTLRMPVGEDWGRELVNIDTSRADRTVRALSERLAAAVGAGGSLTVQVQPRADSVELTLLGARADGSHSSAGMPGALLVGRAATRLFALTGGAFSLDVERLAIGISLPRAEAP